MSLKKELKIAAKLIDNWKVEEADKILSELHGKYPDNNEVKILYAVTQNSLYNRVTVLQLLESILDSNPDHEHAIAMYPSVVLESADKYIEDNNLEPLKERLEKIKKMGFTKIGFDLGSVYNYLSILHVKNGDLNLAVDYMELQKELYKMDDFLNNFHVKSGRVDSKIELIKQGKIPLDM